MRKNLFFMLILTLFFAFIIQKSNASEKAEICIVNGFPFHYEMFGYIIEYCVHRNMPLDIYTETKNNYGWLRFYENNVCSLITFYPISEYTPDNSYRRIILTTDDDPVLKDEWISDKIIAIDHIEDLRKPQIKYHISTRWFESRPTGDYILPAFRLITLEDKQKFSRPAVVCLGGNTELSITKFKKLFSNFESIEFWFVDRKAEPEKFRDYPNVHCVKQMDTTEMLDLCKKSHWMFISDEKKNHMKKSMSAAIMLGYSCLCRIIMPSQMNVNYKYKSVLEYTHTIVLNPVDFSKIDTELIEIQAHKFRVFDKYLL
jgi:hypothetical protein